jgi:hypothetical protein
MTPRFYSRMASASAGGQAALEALAKPFYESPGDDSTGEFEEAEMDVGAFLVTDAQPAEGVKPGNGAFDDPTVATQPFLGLDTTAGDARANAPSAQVLPAKRIVVAFVGV